MRRVRPRSLGKGTAWLCLGAVLAIISHPLVATVVWCGLGGTETDAFPADRLLPLAISHAELTVLAMLPVTIIGIGLGVLVTRPTGASLRPVVDQLAAASQAVPPVVVVALAFPVLGFGALPTILALVLYGLMPVLRSTVGAFDTIAPEVRGAATAMGMTAGQILREVEWPLAVPVILGGVRVALVLSVATAAVGALAGAETLGTPIIIGLQNQKELYLVQGAAATAALAFAGEGLLLLAAGSATRCDPGRNSALP